MYIKLTFVIDAGALFPIPFTLYF